MSEEAARYWDDEASGLMFVPDRPAWQQRAACRGTEPGRFIPPGQSRAQVSIRLAEELAAEFCDVCPVAADCLAYALEAEPRVRGVWAGTTEGGRQKLRGNEPGHTPRTLETLIIDAQALAKRLRVEPTGLTRRALERGLGISQAMGQEVYGALHQVAEEHEQAS